MSTIAMIALTVLDLDGRMAAPGELVYVSPIVAAQLNYARTARFAEPAEEAVPDPAPARAPEPPTASPPKTPQKTPRKRRTYRRRDLTAEP